MHSRFDKPFIIKPVELGNTLTFDSSYYLQTQGTAIGTILAPTYSTLTMEYQEQKFYSIIENRFGLNAKEYFTENCWQFLDDCRILFNSTYIDPEELLEIL